MLRSMYSGVAGLRNHQIRMDAIGNNIANVNTYGFKSSRVSFQDALNQTLRGAAAPSPDGTRGGINALQIGLGMNVACIDVLQTQGSLQNTGKITDCAIQGDGFFVLTDGSQEWYTRAGNFQMERDGRLVNPSNGLMVRGWMGDALGNINTNAPPTEVQLPVGQIMPPLATTEMEFRGQLHPDLNGILAYTPLRITDGGTGTPATIEFRVEPIDFYQYQVTATTTSAGAAITAGGTFNITLDAAGNVVAPVAPGPQITVQFGGLPANQVLINTPDTVAGNVFTLAADVPPDTINTGGVADFDAAQPIVTTNRVYDSLGVEHTLTTTITKTATNTWAWSVVNELGPPALANGVLTFSSTGGQIISSTGGPITWAPLGANPMSIVPDFSALYQNSNGNIPIQNKSPYEVNVPFQNGYPAGQLQGFNIDKLGIVNGVFSNGQDLDLAQLALANFNNPGGLIRSGDTMFQESNNSGPALIGRAGNSGRGLVTPGAVEMSNVDLSAEFTDMITTERGFQANSRIITTSDEMLQELVNLKR